jgi:hypothetical protein
MGWRGFGFVHHSRTIFCRAVPNPDITIRKFCIAVPPWARKAPASLTAYALSNSRITCAPRQETPNSEHLSFAGKINQDGRPCCSRMGVCAPVNPTGTSRTNRATALALFSSLAAFQTLSDTHTHARFSSQRGHLAGHLGGERSLHGQLRHASPSLRRTSLHFLLLLPLLRLRGLSRVR